MTTEVTPPPTSASPTARQVWTRSRGVALALVLLVVAAVAIAVVRSDARHGRLDPRSADPSGSRAVAELLADRGVDTRVVTTLDEAADAAGPDTTLLVAVPDLLTPRQQTRLRTATKNSGGRTVLVASGIASVERLAPGVMADPANSLDSTLEPGCDLPAAVRAGSADTGGIRYSSAHPEADECYRSQRLPTLLRIPAPSGDGDTVLLGAPDILLNHRLDEHGNASLALQLLGSRPHLVWYLPTPADATAGTEDEKSFFDLLPSGWLWGTLQLFVAAALAALWRARRLGPLVPEKLPVAIRASETVEGRARLYRKADARDRAALALRSATRIRLAPLVGVPGTQAHSPEALLPALSARLDGDGPSLRTLLFGPPPGDDAALIRLADQLDALERQVRRP
ncbi:DUF4350 domain-containing protein [Streptomyces cellulosae]|uniref:DUF4350 domain-containing protein n=1 Tax=Streptomyces thermocarboxydus TaxID=59299 RepID=A0ABU3JGC8_9ACTN|nr:DUF4350 domain-containing protein [Streptomyces cellulosae]MDT6974112.1 DUF4350 domain-containing protein [Streptomyces thermocarboxydus]MXQ56058.1 DUF4350 domain-containing protein [Streptomyces sp. XHT-2]MYQ30016.1 DUF4350 domain-containing protein [Streptomyces sp. SID4956]MYW53636.1 DUF4350 domain-containing protein [Streptomyces sp. SID8376]THC47670.1 DUF4350 domain-containing protein [Streptomyces sp. Akac8]